MSDGPERPLNPQPGRPAPPPPEDNSADTQMFRAFVERDETERGSAGGQSSRVVPVVIGLVVVVVVVYLLLQL